MEEYYEDTILHVETSTIPTMPSCTPISAVLTCLDCRQCLYYKCAQTLRHMGILLWLKLKLRLTPFFISREMSHVYKHCTAQTFLSYINSSLEYSLSGNISLSSGGFLIYLWGMCTCVSEKVKEREKYANTAAVIVCNYSVRREIKIM